MKYRIYKMIQIGLFSFLETLVSILNYLLLQYIPLQCMSLIIRRCFVFFFHFVTIIYFHPEQTFIVFNDIHGKKILVSDWLRAVQLKCNTSAKSVTPFQIIHRNSGL